MNVLTSDNMSCPAINSGSVSYQLLGLLLNTLSESYCGSQINWPDDYADQFGRDGK